MAMKKQFTDDEVKTFIRRTNEELVIQDPRPVLEDLGIDYKEIGHDSYRMNLRNEDTPSAFISLKNGVWRYKDFGNGKSGNIVNVVMDFTNKDYKAALNYSLQTLHVKNHLDEALHSKQQDYTLSQTDRERIKAQKEKNMSREASHPLSRVVGVYEVATNQLAIDYLAARGIVKIPPHMKIISGEYTLKNGEQKKAFGVGVLTQDGKGADIHFLKKIGDLKTMSFGEKEISFFKNPNSNKVAIFESKMDYAAAYQQMPLDNVNIIIANSTSNALKVAELLKKANLTQSVMMFNQNDISGYKFTAQIAQEAGLESFKSIRYDVMGEYKTDINDLLLKGEKIADRIETRGVEYFESIANSLESIQKVQKQPPIAITREDIQMANQPQSQERER